MGSDPSFFNILFIDIETVPEVAHFSELSKRMQSLWIEKSKRLWKNEVLDFEALAELYQTKAAIFAEFGKVVCISMGYFSPIQTSKYEFRIKSIADYTEMVILNSFNKVMMRYQQNRPKILLCGHNIREFDFPYLCRRMIINQIPLPKIMQVYGQKPWELKYLLDTLNLWKFGDVKHYISLDLLAAVLGIASPKSDLDGSKVGSEFYAGRLKDIVKYCENDVLTTLKIYLRLFNLSPEYSVNILTNYNYD